MKTIKVNCEFASELVCVIPYAHWLHQNNQLEKVITSKGMTPFYYFCDNVEEIFEHRTFDINVNGLNNVPNNWIHHSVGEDYLNFSEEEQEDVFEWFVQAVQKFEKSFNPLLEELSVK